ncbi:MAG TPA: protein kinase [Vicinamibacterales bacterium]
MSPALRCPSCGAPVDDARGSCPACDSPLPWNDGEKRLAASDETHLAAPDETRLSSSDAHVLRDPRLTPRDQRVTTSRDPQVTTSRDPWLTKSDIDHGRFQPGAVLDDRYRVIGRLGRGGMGEVYRADDLRLGQAVALKFLPEAVDRDPARLTQLHTEVRLARQVSHPNVCRVYDVGEYEGHTFLSMEYVDGEDLATLLRRIGRFPQDRAIELARQICAGLAAAHDRGVVHRDLKPANIMLDSSGRIRITDFGLAGASGETIRAGTPAYMAPEQLAGSEVTPRSDLYSLGLVLYEMFTGRRALEGANLAELIAKREQAGITHPSDLVRDLDPAIDRAILRCLDPDPARRPGSALAVAAALPGGDPLAAALAAGETPSPEMVAAAGTTSALKPLAASVALAITLALLVTGVVAADRQLVTSIAPLPKSPLLLVERAREILALAGQTHPTADSAYGFFQPDYVNYLKNHPELNTRDRLRSGDPPTLHFWYRGSPTVMIPTGDSDRVTASDPPMTTSNMTMVYLDPQGRLIRMSVVPPQVDPAPRTGAGAPGPGAQPGVDWKPLFEASGFDFSQFKPVEPEWTPAEFADARFAWTGPLPGIPGQTLRIEGASYRGKPVSFLRVAPWTRGTRQVSTIEENGRVSWVQAIATLTIFSMLVSAAVVARHNLRRGRGDRRGAFQLAAFVSVVAFVVWLLNTKHIPDPDVEMSRFFNGQPIWAAGLLWLLYLAVEPYVRRFWPTTVVSWSRLMARQWRDPLVGRDILFGVLLGLQLFVIDLGGNLLDQRFGQVVPPRVAPLANLLGTRFVLGVMGNQVFNSFLSAMVCVFGMVLLKIIFRTEWAAVIAAIALFSFTSTRSMTSVGPFAINLLSVILFISIIVLTIKRLGLLSTVVLFLVNSFLSTSSVTLDTSRWFFADALLPVVVVAALACYGFYASRGGEPLFGKRLLD